jgi:cytoskeleton protein RodZ
MSNKDRAKPEATEEQVERIGLRLRRGREAKGLSLSDVVKQLNLASEIVEALESDDAEALPSAVFVQGYLRSYAKIIDIDAEPLITLYKAQTPQKELGTLSQPSIKQEVHSGHGAVRAISWVIGLGLIALVAFWWVNQGEEMLAVDTLVKEPISETPVLTLPKIAEIEESVVEEPQAGVEEPTIDIPTEVIEEPAPIVEELPTAIPEPVIEQVELDDKMSLSSDTEWEIVITFTGSCWVNIRDADGKRRIVGNISEGTVHILEGPAPYNVILGNATAVELRINGQLIDLSPYSRGNVARFALNPAELVAQ